MRGLAEGLVAHAPPEAVVTDAGSVKTSVVSDLESVLGPRFIGAHPIAGSEQSGLPAARADLFDSATCVITPTRSSDPRALTVATAFWQSVGCRTMELSPEDHDAALARTSHLPHLVASALVAAATSRGLDLTSLAGSGFRDSTRISQGNPDLWTGILAANRSAVASSVAELREILQNVQDMLTNGDDESLRQFLQSAADARRAVPTPSTHAVQG